VSLADELMKLEQLRASGALSEAEFQSAKETALRTAASTQAAADTEADAVAAAEAEQPTEQVTGCAIYVFFGFLVLLIFLVAFLTSL
jgi:hypothetical protein